MSKQDELVMLVSSALLDIVDNRDGFDRGDLQGAIEAQVSMCIKKAQQTISRDVWEKVGFKNDWGLER